MNNLSFDFKVYRLRIHPITPVHIFGGEEIDRFDYVVHRNTFRRIDLFNFFDSIARKKIEVIEEFLKLDFAEFRKVIDEIDKLVESNEEAIKNSTIWWAGMSEEALEHLKNPQKEALYPVKAFTRGGFRLRPYIPGSSIKGSVNTAIIFHLRKEGKIKKEVLDKMLERALIGESPNDSLGRLIRISDTIGTEKGQIKTYIFKAKRVRKDIREEGKNHIPQFVECWYDPSKGSDEKGNYSEHILELVEAPRSANIKTFGLDLNPDTLAKICNDYYVDELLKNEDESIRKEIQDRLNKAGKNSFVLRLGWGCGKEAFTLNLKKAKTKWVAGGGRNSKDEPFGWCVAQILERNADS